MISRVVDHCFWFGRYIERAEATARMLAASVSLALDAELPPAQVWRPVVVVSGEELGFSTRLAGGELLKAGKARGLRVAAEGFSDRTYQADGSLTPRNRPDALITNEPAAVAQVLRLVREGRVRSTDGADVSLAVQTVCVHGDGDRAVVFARELRAALAEAGLTVRSPS